MIEPEEDNPGNCKFGESGEEGLRRCTSLNDLRFNVATGFGLRLSLQLCSSIVHK